MAGLCGYVVMHGRQYHSRSMCDLRGCPVLLVGSGAPGCFFFMDLRDMVWLYLVCVTLII